MDQNVQQKLDLLDFILGNLKEIKIKDFGWMYGDDQPPDVIAVRLSKIQKMLNERKDEE